MKKILVLALALAAVSPARSAGLKANMGELLLRNLQPGQTYDLMELLNFPLRITYQEAADSQLVIAPYVPVTPEEMKEGFEPIPDPAWVSVVPSTFDIVGEGTAEAQVKVTIPDDDAHLGKKYVVYLWSRTRNKQRGVSLGLGVKSRLLLAINSERVAEEPGEVPAAERTSLNFRLAPAEIKSAKPVSPGRKYSLRNLSKERLTLENQDERERSYKVEPVPGADLAITLPPGCAWPPADALQVPQSVLTVPGKGKAEIRAELRLPKDPALRGKTFLFILRVSPEGRGVATGGVARIFVTTKP